jgi:hypothetical protein
MKTFDRWDIDEVESTFGLRRMLENDHLHAWLSAASVSIIIPDALETIIETMREKLQLYGDLWNEDELKFQVIAPLISFVDFTIESKNVHTFTQRFLSAVVQDIPLSGRVDFVVATGKAKPIQPFFFLHEYKRERTGESDPRAQLLVEMLAAQQLNEAAYPLYGCYIVGRNWFFVVLDGTVYAESNQYAASDKDDIRQIFAILLETKAIITRLAEQYA